MRNFQDFACVPQCDTIYQGITRTRGNDKSTTVAQLEPIHLQRGAQSRHTILISLPHHDFTSHFLRSCIRVRASMHCIRSLPRCTVVDTFPWVVDGSILFRVASIISSIARLAQQAYGHRIYVSYVRIS